VHLGCDVVEGFAEGAGGFAQQAFVRGTDVFIIREVETEGGGDFFGARGSTVPHIRDTSETNRTHSADRITARP